MPYFKLFYSHGESDFNFDGMIVFIYMGILRYKDSDGNGRGQEP